MHVHIARMHHISPSGHIMLWVNYSNSLGCRHWAYKLCGTISFLISAFIRAYISAFIRAYISALIRASIHGYPSFLFVIFGRPRSAQVNRLEGLSLPRNSTTINWPGRHDLVVDWAVKPNTNKQNFCGINLSTALRQTVLNSITYH